jgi:hypothetical protein
MVFQIHMVNLVFLGSGCSCGLCGGGGDGDGVKSGRSSNNVKLMDGLRLGGIFLLFCWVFCSLAWSEYLLSALFNVFQLSL